MSKDLGCGLLSSGTVWDSGDVMGGGGCGSLHDYHLMSLDSLLFVLVVDCPAGRELLLKPMLILCFILHCASFPISFMSCVGIFL